MKMEVEGHDERICRGALKTLNQDQPIEIFECFHPATPVVTQLRDFGYLLLDVQKTMVDHLGNETNLLVSLSRHVRGAEEIVATRKHEYHVLMK